MYTYTENRRQTIPTISRATPTIPLPATMVVIALAINRTDSTISHTENLYWPDRHSEGLFPKFNISLWNEVFL